MRQIQVAVRTFIFCLVLSVWAFNASANGTELLKNLVLKHQDVNSLMESLWQQDPSSAIRLLAEPELLENPKWQTWFERGVLWADTNAIEAFFMSAAGPNLYAPDVAFESSHVTLAKLLLRSEVTIAPNLVRVLMSYPKAEQWYQSVGRNNYALQAKYGRIIKHYFLDREESPTDLSLFPIQRTRALLATPEKFDIAVETDNLIDECPICVTKLLNDETWIKHPNYRRWLHAVMFAGQTHKQQELGESIHVRLAKMMTSSKMSFTRDELQFLMKQPDVQLWFAKVGFKNKSLMAKYEQMILDFFKYDKNRELAVPATNNLMDMMRDPEILNHLRFVEHILKGRLVLSHYELDYQVSQALSLPFWRNADVVKDFINESAPSSGFWNFRGHSQLVNSSKLFEALSRRSLIEFLDEHRIQLMNSCEKVWN